MAERRMFAKTIIDSDAFLDMPLSTQALYFHLSMRADDDGFINNPKKIQRVVGASEDDLRLLIAKNFLIPFESGVVVIKHWKIHNYIQKDRYNPTVYEDEKRMLTEKPNKAYTLAPDTRCIQDVYRTETQVRLGKVSKGLGKEREGSAERFTPPTLDEVKAYVHERGDRISAEAFVAYYESIGWKSGKTNVTDWKAKVRLWEAREEKQPELRQQPKGTFFDFPQREIDEEDEEALELRLRRKALGKD